MEATQFEVWFTFGEKLALAEKIRTPDHPDSEVGVFELLRFDRKS